MGRNELVMGRASPQPALPVFTWGLFVYSRISYSSLSCLNVSTDISEAGTELHSGEESQESPLPTLELFKEPLKKNPRMSAVLQIGRQGP